ncbi:MAG TPA: vWA domain-containing protein [Phycisphaerae bacterium]|nr:vWA domain-containing protein [Phycisphaerae bacterium]
MSGFLEWLLDTELGELTNGTDWRLGFVGEYSDYMVLGLIAVFAALAYLTIRSYRREGDAPLRAKIALAALRIAVILLLFAVIFRPAIILRFVKTLHSSVLVLVDDSLSMSFRDRYASEEAKDLRNGLVETVVKDPNRLPSLSRKDIVSWGLMNPDGPLAKLASDHPLIFMAYSTANPGKEPYTRLLGTVNEVVENPQGRPNAAAAIKIGEILKSLRADGYETNHSAALRAAMERTQGQRVEGFVLVSDGRITAHGSGSRLRSALEYAAERGVPIYPVVVGDPTPLKNIAITSLDAPREVRKGTKAEFTAWLAFQNMAGQAVTVHLERRDPETRLWEDTGVASEITLQADPAANEAGHSKGLQSVALHVQPQQRGQFDYRAIVRPGPEEQNTEDNFAETTISVADEKIKILFISGDAGWEYQFVSNYLLGQPELYRVSVWQQNADKEINQRASEGMHVARLPRELPELLGVPGDEKKTGYDLVILYDPQHTEGGFDQHFVNDVLRPFVEEHGAGVCFIVGNKYSELNLLGGDTFRSLSYLLPVTLASNTMGLLVRIEAGSEAEESWPVRLTPYGIDHPVMRLAGSTKESKEVWEVLPGIFWSHPVYKLKPASRVLAENSNPMYRTADGEPQPLIVTQPFGRGRVLYIGFDATWRWRYVQDGYYQRRFWANVMQYLATLKARRVIITTGGDRFDVGKEITIDVTAYDEQFRPLKDKTFDVEMIRTDTSESKTLTLKALEGKPGRYKLTIQAIESGTYGLTALRGVPNAEELVAGKRFLIELPRAEAERPEADEATMKAVASRTDNFLRIPDMSKLAEMIPPGRLTSVDEFSRELWDSKLTLLLIVILLGIEWILRKKYNMA